MKASLSLVAVLAAVASACKCVDNKGHANLELTTYVCKGIGTYMKGDDCPAASISEKLTAFDYGCYLYGDSKHQSDCSHGAAHPRIGKK